MNRYGAFAAHLAISAVIFVILMALVITYWFPGFLFATDGGWQGTRIVIAVDLVLGPLLTLVVFKPGKPGLRFDLTVIALLQAAGIAGGVAVIHSERPIAIVHADGHFYSMSRDDYRDYGVEVPELSGFDAQHPPWIHVALPEDVSERARLRGALFRDERPVRTWAPGYRELETRRVPEDAEPAATGSLLGTPRYGAAIAAFLEEHGGELGDYLLYPFHARYGLQYLAFRREDRRFVDLVATNDPAV